MLNFVKALRSEGASVVRRSIWLLAAAVLLVGSAGLAAAAAAVALASVLPLPLALALCAIGVLASALACLLVGDRNASPAPQSASQVADGGAKSKDAAGVWAGVSALLSRMDAGLLDKAGQMLLLTRIQKNPGATLALAAIAGLAIAAIDHFMDGAQTDESQA